MILNILINAKPKYFYVANFNHWKLVGWATGVIVLPYFSFQPVLHDWCNKGSGMCYPVCHIEEPLLLIGKE